MKPITGICIGDTTVYRDKLPDRKRPSLVIEKNGVHTLYGTFTNEAAALEFFRVIAEALREPEEP